MIFNMYGIVYLDKYLINRKIIISNPDITQAATVLRKNMKRRFPMMMKHDDEWEIVYEYRNPIGGSLVRYNENKEIEFNKIQLCLIHMNI